MTSSVSSDESEKPKEVVDNKNLDNFLNMGRYSFVIIIFCELILFNQAGNMYYMVYAGAPPTLIGCHNHPTTNFSDSQLCDLYHNGSCDPILDSQFISINVEWNLLCGEGKQVKDSTSYQMAGYILGAIMVGQVSDSYGRKWPMFVCLLATFVFGIGSAFSPNLLVFTILRFLVSLFGAGHICTMVVFICEVFPKKHRMWLNFILCWSPVMLLVSGLAYICENWRTFAIVLNIFAGIACIILWFAFESPYWLIGVGRVAEAEEHFQKISKFDGRNLDLDELKAVLKAEKVSFEEKKTDRIYSYQHIFYTWRLTSYTFSLGFSYFVVSVVNYGILFNMETIAGSMYWNTSFSGIVRIGLNVLTALVEFNFVFVGRKLLHLIFSMYAAVSVLMIITIQVFEYEMSMAEFIRFLAISSGSVICQIYCVNTVSTNEIYPTAIRNIAYAVMFLMESMGIAFGPQIFELTIVHPIMPYIVMLGLIISQATFYACFIPETKGKQLTDLMPCPEERIFRRKSSPKAVTLL